MHALGEAGPEELHERRLRARLLAALETGQRAAVHQAHDLDVDPGARDLADGRADRRRARAARASAETSSSAMRCSTCSLKAKPVPRSCASVVIAISQPRFTSPMTCARGTGTASRNTSLNSVEPVICRSGRIVMPGLLHVEDEVGEAAVLRAATDRCARAGSPSARTARSSSTPSARSRGSRRRRARRACAPRRDRCPRSGSLKSWHQISSPVRIGGSRRRFSVVACRGR